MLGEMIESGFSQQKISDLIVKRGVPCTQPTVYRMYKGKSTLAFDRAEIVEDIYKEFKNGTLIDVLVQ